MNRSRIETYKAAVMGVIALIVLLLVVSLHDYTMVWVPAILGLTAGWFAWKANYFSDGRE